MGFDSLLSFDWFRLLVGVLLRDVLRIRFFVYFDDIFLPGLLDFVEAAKMIGLCRSSLVPEYIEKNVRFPGHGRRGYPDVSIRGGRVRLGFSDYLYGGLAGRGFGAICSICAPERGFGVRLNRLHARSNGENKSMFDSVNC